MIYLPEKCLRNEKGCKPLAQIESDYEGHFVKRSFVCCGLSDVETREVKEDRFRLCWYNKDVDEIGDYSETDLKDTLSVIAQALSIDQHIKENKLL